MWTTVLLTIACILSLIAIIMLNFSLNRYRKLAKLYKEEVEIYEQKTEILEQTKANCEIIETNQEQLIKWRDKWLNSLIIELISAMVAANPDIDTEALDKKVYQLVREAGITDNWLKENEWWVEDDESTDV